MSEFKVAELVGQPREWQGKNNSQWTSFYVKCDGDQRQFEVVRKRGAEAPTVGEVIDATVEAREHNGNTYYKLKPVGQGGFGGRGRSPEERRSIARQHAQKAAMSYADIKAEKGDLPSPFKVSDLKPIIDWLYQDVLAAERSGS